MDFCQSFRLTTTINWPRNESDLFRVQPETGDITISLDFEEHVREIRHWTVSDAFREEMPQLYFAINGSRLAEVQEHVNE